MKSVTICLLAFVCLTFSALTHALDIIPTIVSGTEGDSIALEIKIGILDQYPPSEALAERCKQIGYAGSNIVRFMLKRVDGSAVWGSSANTGDLHLTENGSVMGNAPISLWCVEGPWKLEMWDKTKAVQLHVDGIEEPSESAALELYWVDGNDNEVYVKTIELQIENQDIGVGACPLDYCDH